MKIIISFIIGYFVGLISSLSQIFYMEKKYGKKIKDILDEDTKTR